MAYVPVPKDLTKVKTKVIFNLTKRQLICFGGGALIGVPLYFLLRGSLGSSPAAIVMVVSMLPFFLFGLYEKDGQPLEKVLRDVADTLYRRPQARPYETNNLYAAIMRQDRNGQGGTQDCPKTPNESSPVRKKPRSKR